MRRVRVLAALLAAAIAGATAGCGIGGSPQKTLSASFERAVGVYVHSDVRVLGVRIGEVTRIVPEGRTVRIDMTYDASYRLPADAKAVLVAPSIVSDRYVQLTPVWRGGAVLASGATIGQPQTAVPVELDQIYASLNKLNVALGPQGANRNGALSDLLHVSARNLEGNGPALHGAITDLSQAVGTLSAQREDLFGTVRNLQEFTTTLARSDATVRRFNANLADVAAQLSGEKEDLALAVRSLSVALGEVAVFVAESKRDLTANVTDLASVTTVLVKQKKALQEFLDTAPTALSNLQLAYNPRSGTLDTRDNSSRQPSLALLCDLLVKAGQPRSLCSTLTDLLKPPSGPPALPGLPAPALPAVPAPPGAPVRLPAPATAPSGPDLTLGGVLPARP